MTARPASDFVEGLRNSGQAYLSTAPGLATLTYPFIFTSWAREGTQMGAIIQTLALAMVLLIVGLSCVVIGVTGLAFLARREWRKREETEKEAPAGRPRLIRPGHEQHGAVARIQIGQPLLLLLDSGVELALVFQQSAQDHHRLAG